MALQIEVRKSYRTRDGRVAFVSKKDTDKDIAWPFLGTIIMGWGAGENLSWNEQGQYMGSDMCPEDLVSEYNEQTPPQ